LIDIYEKQKELDNSVKIFRDVCNKYLINKEVFYDESAIKIYIKSESTEAEIALSKLSSGEKQIISIFSKIYLSDADKRFIVLFDEPELSLSMTWQKQLLPDIINSEKCNFLLAVTHSPFIFDNELDRFAVGLNEYIEPINVVFI
jgi:predicted ATPase